MAINDNVKVYDRSQPETKDNTGFAQEDIVDVNNEVRVVDKGVSTSPPVTDRGKYVRTIQGGIGQNKS